MESEWAERATVAVILVLLAVVMLLAVKIGDPALPPCPKVGTPHERCRP